MEKPATQCPACGREDLRVWIEVGVFSYLECRQCSLVSLRADHIRTPESIYTSDYFESGSNSGYTDYAADEPTHRLNARRHLRRMRQHGIRPPGILIDLGCAGGFFMSEAASAGWTVFGVDISPWSREQVRSRFGFEAFESIGAASRRIGRAVDAVTAFQVLEHMPNILSTLKDLRNALRAEGSLVIETWNRSSVSCRLMGGAWQQLSPPSVVHLFNSVSLEKLLDRSGFCPARLRPMSKFLSAAWAAGLVASKTHLEPLRKLASARLLRRIPIPYFFDDLAYLATSARP